MAIDKESHEKHRVCSCGGTLEFESESAVGPDGWPNLGADGPHATRRMNWRCCKCGKIFNKMEDS